MYTNHIHAFRWLIQLHALYKVIVISEITLEVLQTFHLYWDTSFLNHLNNSELKILLSCNWVLQICTIVGECTVSNVKSNKTAINNAKVN